MGRCDVKKEYIFGIVIPLCFFNQCLGLLSTRKQFSEHYTFNCYLQHVSAVFGYHQVDFTANMEKNTEVEGGGAAFQS